VSSYDAIIVQNLTYRSIDVSYNLLQGLFVTSIPALSMVIIDGVRLENLTASVRDVLIPRGYLKVKQYLSTTKVPKPAYWIESGLPSRCLAIAALTSNIHTRTDYSFSKTVTELATFGGTLVYTPAGTAYTIVGTASGAHALASHITAQYKITKALHGLAGLAGTLDYTAATGTTWDPTYPNSGGGFTYSNGDLTVTMTANQFAARGTTTHTTGKWYYEITLNSITGGVGEMLTGIIPDTANGSIRIYECGDQFTFDVLASGILYALSYNGSNLATPLGSPAGPSSGEVLGFAIDLDTPLVSLVYKGVTYNSPYLPIASHAYRIGFAMQIGNAGVATLNTLGSFNTAPPSGYIAWDASPSGIGSDAIGSTLQVY
jgi:hypothetical protein